MLIDLDLTGVDISGKRGGFEPLPHGKYNAMVDAAEVVPTQAGGKMLSLKCKVLDGEHMNRVVFWRLNIQNDSKKAQEIAYVDLAILLKNIGLSPDFFSDPQTLIGKPFEMGLKITPAKGDWPAKNEVNFTEPAKNQPPVAPMTGRPTPPLTATVAAPPWG